jgi:hypothetical protein
MHKLTTAQRTPEKKLMRISALKYSSAHKNTMLTQKQRKNFIVQSSSSSSGLPSSFVLGVNMFLATSEQNRQSPGP